MKKHVLFALLIVIAALQVSTVCAQCTGGPVFHSFVVNICPWDFYSFNGQQINSPGAYSDTIPLGNGCDSIVTVSVQITDLNPGINVNGAVCSVLQGNAGYQWLNCTTGQPINGAQNQSYTATQNGSYACIIYKGGCIDTTDCVTVTGLACPPVFYSFTQNICPGTTYTFDGQQLSSPGAYNDTIALGGGCDSIVTLNLQITDLNDSVYVNGVVCGVVQNNAGYQWIDCSTNQPISGAQSQTYTATENGSYACIIYKGNCSDTTGCVDVTSIVACPTGPVLHSFVANICPGVEYTFNEKVLTEPGVYSDTIPLGGGCDSIVTLTLQITDLNDSVYANGAGLGVVQNNAGYQWINCSNNQAINGAINQTFTPTQNGSYACVIFKGSCTDTTDCVNITGIGINEMANYKFNLHPNPNTGNFTMQHNYNGNTEIKVVNAIGELVKEFNLSATTGSFNISELAAGVYQVIISNRNEKLATVKLVKQ